MSELDELRAVAAPLKAERDIQRLQSYHYPNPVTGKPWPTHKEKTA